MNHHDHAIRASMTFNVLAMFPCIVGCLPDFSDTPSLITSPRVLAIEAEPAEARPGGTVSLHAILASPDSYPTDDSEFAFAFCTSPRPFGAPTNVNVDCFDDAKVSIPGESATVSATVPFDACQRFGPDPPPGDFRPMDPDGTGGFYQPVLVTWRGIASIFELRLLCSLPDASQDIAAKLATEYSVNNRPPQPTVNFSTAIKTEASGLAFVRDAASLEVRWARTSAETYLWYNPDTFELSKRKEVLTISLFSTVGILKPQTIIVTENSTVTSAPFEWSELPVGHNGSLWVVISDSRGAMTILSR